MERFFCKKFFIIICGICATTGALGAKSKKDPITITDSAIINSWGFGGNYTQSVAGKFMHNDSLNQRKGACGTDEGAGVAIIARQIWEHGGYFCTTQIQSANAGGKSWIEFYKNTDNLYKCETICMPGWTGVQCKTRSTGCDDTTDYTNNLDDVINNYKTLLKSDGCETGIITTEVDVFRHVTNSENTHSNAHVLGVLERKTHGVKVGIIQINANRKNNHNSYIADVYSDGLTRMLCANGYVANSNQTDCIPGPSCATEQDKLNNLCSGFSNYNSSEHSFKYNSAQGCYYFLCQNGKGFKSEIDKTCVECDGGVLAYVDENGYCQKCVKGKYFTNSDKTSCNRDTQSYNQTEMRYGSGNESSPINNQCWLKTDNTEYKECIQSQLNK